jgi:uncharacterized repeat protein (TIGR01451 family)
VKVTRCWSGTNGLKVRALLAGMVLLAAGCMVLGGSSRSRSSQNASVFVPASELQDQVTISASPVAQPLKASKQRVLAAFRQLPLIFEPNVGQANAGVRFLVRGAGYDILLDSDSAVIGSGNSSTRRSEGLRMRLAGASTSARVAGSDLLPGKTNYFIGNDPAKWRRNVPHFARVRYESIYPGINLVFYGNQGRLEYDFQVAPGADPSQAELEFDGSQIELAHGNVIAKGENGVVRLEAPRVYQQIEGHQRPVAGRFVMRAGNRVGFEIGPYDHSRELVIDPTLTSGFSTYFGGSGNETFPSVAVDNAQNVYLAGSTTSPVNTFPQPAASTTLLGTNANVFVAKVDPTGATLLYLTFLGGGGTDTNVGLGVDGGGNAYIAGTTTSGIGGTADFPTTGTNAYQSVPAGGSAGTSHVYVSQLDATGSTLRYSSYLSGNGTDAASGMTIDNKGDLFVTGTTTSTDTGGTSVGDQFPASSPPQAEAFHNFSLATNQFFVTKVNTVAAGIGSIAYSTYFGGGTPTNGTAQGGGIAVDSTGNIYFTGTTNFTYTGTSPTTDFPILNAYQPCLDTAPPATHTNPDTCTSTSATNTDAFVAKLNPSANPGSQLIWSTYFGGSQTDSGAAIALDTGAANVYLTGTTNSPDITIPATLAPYQKCLNDLFTGTFIAPTCTTQTAPAPNDAYVARLNNVASGNIALTYFSYLGGSADEAGLAVAVDTANDALLTGWTKTPTGGTSSGQFPVTTGANQSALKGTQDAFLAHLNTTTVTGQNTLGAFVTYFGGTGVGRGTSLRLDTSLNTYLAGDTNAPDLQVQAALQPQNNGGFDAFVAKFGTAADLAITGKLTLAAGQSFVSAGSLATFTYTVTNNGPDVATNVTVTDNLTGTGIPLTPVSASASPGSCTLPTTASNSVVCSISSLQSGATAAVTIVLTPTAFGQFNGGAVTVSSSNNNDPNPSNNTANVSGQASDFSVSVSPANQSIQQAGDTAVYTVTLTPHPVYTGSISLSVSGLPNNSTSSFTTNPVTLINVSGATSTLNIATQPRPVPVANSGARMRPIYAIWLAIPGMALLGYGAGNDRRRRRIAGILLVCAMGLLTMLQPACSKQATTTATGGTPAGTSNLVVTATSGSFTKNANIATLTVP